MNGHAKTTLMFTALLSFGCYEKEAVDPHDLLAEDLAEIQVGPPTEVQVDEPSQGEQKEAATTPATRADCEKAVRHMIELGQRLERDQEADPKARGELETRHKTEMQSADMKQRIKALTDDCLAQKKSRQETECIARVEREQDIDRCVK